MWRPVITAVLLIMVQLPLAAFAQERAPMTSAPVIPHGWGERCIADRDVMRRDHMRMLLRYRHQVVREGAHQPQHGIEDCVSCHAVKGVDGGPVSIDSPQHFCRVCHDYAAVRIDCFECHPSRPQALPVQNGRALTGDDVAALEHYLRDVKP